MNHQSRAITVCLLGLAASLLLVGVVSGTVVRHIVQIVPAAIAFATVASGRRWAPYLAVPIFTVWLLLMVLIWLYLAGVQTFFTGTFSTIEVVLTIMIGAFSVVGICASARSSAGSRLAIRTAAVLVGIALQIAAMWVSFLEPLANR